jgi:hypothetical protein
MNPLEWPILVAQVGLRAWSASLERYLNGAQTALPELDPRSCRFGIWLEAEKIGARSSSPALREMDALHDRAHAAAQKAVSLKEIGKLDEALSLVRSANALMEEVDAKLSAFSQVYESSLI